MGPLPTPSYFPYATKKGWIRSRAWWRLHHEQFSKAQLLVQHLVTTSRLFMTQTLTRIPSHGLVTLTLFQVEWMRRQWTSLTLTTSTPMRWKCFILFDPPQQHGCITLITASIPCLFVVGAGHPYQLDGSRHIWLRSAKDDWEGRCIDT